MHILEAIVFGMPPIEGEYQLGRCPKCGGVGVIVDERHMCVECVNRKYVEYKERRR